MTHCAECCFGTGVDAEIDCPAHGLNPDLEAERRKDWDANAAEDGGCTCPVTPRHMWFSYYGAIEPGSQQEFDSACPVHACRECGAVAREVESFVESRGHEAAARTVRVAVLGCGHEVVTAWKEGKP